MTTPLRNPDRTPTSSAGVAVGRVGASIACAGVTAFVLLGIGFGRSTACTSDYSCATATCDPCLAITLTLALAHLANMGICALVIWLVLRHGGRWRLIAAQALGLAALVVVVIYLSARGVTWG